MPLREGAASDTTSGVNRELGNSLGEGSRRDASGAGQPCLTYDGNAGVTLTVGLG